MYNVYGTSDEHQLTGKNDEINKHIIIIHFPCRGCGGGPVVGSSRYFNSSLGGAFIFNSSPFIAVFINFRE